MIMVALIGIRLGENYKANMAKLQSELQNMPLQGSYTKAWTDRRTDDVNSELLDSYVALP